MTTDDLMMAISELGWKIVIDGGRPVLRGSEPGTLRDKLVKVLRLPVHRDEIVRRLAPMQASVTMECLWSTGFVGKHWFPDNGWPVGAWWFRNIGEQTWQVIPGTPGESTTTPFAG